MGQLIIRGGELYRERTDPNTGKRSWRKIPHLNLVCRSCGWQTLSTVVPVGEDPLCVCGGHFRRTPDREVTPAPKG